MHRNGVRSWRRVLLIAVTGGFGVVPVAMADDLIGVYAGAAEGQAQIAVGVPAGVAAEVPDVGGFRASHTAYTLLAGVRPVSFVGAEVAYMDFGRASGGFGAASGSVRLDAAAAYGMLYLPVPLIDVYVKAGVARFEGQLRGTATSCGVGSSCPSASFGVDRTETGGAAGVGLQLKLGSLGLRAEYQRFSVLGGTPSLTSFGALWSF